MRCQDLGELLVSVFPGGHPPAYVHFSSEKGVSVALGESSL